MNAYQHGYDDAKFGFTYIPDDAKEYQRGYADYLKEQKRNQEKRFAQSEKRFLQEQTRREWASNNLID